MEKSFAKAKPQLKGAIAEIKSALQNKDYPGAYQREQALCDLPELTQDQRMVTTRASLTLMGVLQTAQNQGDPESTRMVEFVKRNR